MNPRRIFSEGRRNKSPHFLRIEAPPSVIPCPCYDSSMHRRLFAFFATAIVLLMIVPPVLNAFDSWDKTPELPIVGHDTETTLMVMACEAGMGVAVAWASIRLLDWLAAVLLPGIVAAAPLRILRGIRATAYLLLLFSPPWRVLSLRI